MPSPRSLLFWPSLAAALLAAGCAPGPEPGRPAPEKAPAPAPALDPDKLMERGEYAPAAEVFARRAEQADPQQRSHWRLRQAQALFQAGRSGRARSLARSLADTDQQVPATLLRVRILVEQNSLTQARALLDTLLGRNLADPQRARALQLLGQIHTSQDRPGNALDAYIGQYRLLESAAERQSAHEAIRQSLQAMPEERLRQRLERTRQALPRGYLRFALIMRGVGERPVDETRRLLEQWLSAFPDHPLGTIVSKRMERVQAGPLKVALLLPMDSRYEPLAHGVLHGVLAAHFQTGTGNNVHLRVLDTAATEEGARRALQRARNLEMDAIIGPLTPEAVQAVTRATERGWISAPVLMLNTRQRLAGGSDSLFQLGLDPEEEARQVAEEARQRNLERAAVLYPDNSRGKRLVAAFLKRWQQSDGLTYALETFDAGDADHSATLRELLDLDELQARTAQLEQTLDANLQEYNKPPRRRDLDFLVLLAQPEAARLIKPQLAFFAAGDLPVLATSSVFASGSTPSERRDMDGVRFLQMPWFLDPQGERGRAKADLARHFPRQSSSQKRLNALGFDAYRLMTRSGNLARLSERSVAEVLQGMRMEGATGALAVEDDGWVRRRLDWAYYEGGRVVPKAEAETEAEAETDAETDTEARSDGE